jgi:hypothetical protein
MMLIKYKTIPLNPPYQTRAFSFSKFDLTENHKLEGIWLFFLNRKLIIALRFKL